MTLRSLLVALPRSFADIQGEAEGNGLLGTFPAGVLPGDALPSCFTHTMNKCPLGDLFSATFFLSVLFVSDFTV